MDYKRLSNKYNVKKLQETDIVFTKERYLNDFSAYLPMEFII